MSPGRCRNTARTAFSPCSRSSAPRPDGGRPPADGPRAPAQARYGPFSAAIGRPGVRRVEAAVDGGFDDRILAVVGVADFPEPGVADTQGSRVEGDLPPSLPAHLVVLQCPEGRSL